MQEISNNNNKLSLQTWQEFSLIRILVTDQGELSFALVLHTVENVHSSEGLDFLFICAFIVRLES